MGWSYDKKRNLGKGISQRFDGRYHARAVVNGKRIELYNRDLKQLKIDFEKAKTEALVDDTSEDKDIKLSEFLEIWMRDYKAPRLKSEISRNAYYRRIKNTYGKLLGDKNVRDILHFDVQNITNKLIEDGYTYRTVREALGALKEAMDIAVINKFADLNPVVRINIQKENEVMQERRVLDDWEIPLFLSECEQDHFHEAFKILLATGLRAGEFAALTWDSINLNKREIYVNKSLTIGYFEGRKIETVSSPKSASGYRTIPMFDGVPELFISWKKKQDALKKKLGSRWRADESLGDIIFCTSLGSPASRYAISHSLEKIQRNMQSRENYMAKQEGREPRAIEHLHPHCLRHTFCTQCLQRGVDIMVIRQWMGHSSISVTEQYTHILDNKHKEEAEKIGNFFN